MTELENTDDEEYLNGICVVREAGKIALGTHSGFYDYTYDPSTNTLANSSWSPLPNVTPLVRPLQLLDGTILIIGRDYGFSEFTFHLWAEGGAPIGYLPNTQMRPFGRILHNTGRVIYTRDLYPRGVSEFFPGFYTTYGYRAYIEGEFAWEKAEGGYYDDITYIFFVDEQDSVFCTGAFRYHGYHSGLRVYEAVECCTWPFAVSCEGNVLWQLRGGKGAGARNLAPAPGNRLMLFQWRLASWLLQWRLIDGLGCYRIEDAGYSDEPAVLRVHSFVIDDTLVLCAALFSDDDLDVDAYFAMGTPSGSLLFLPSLSPTQSPMFQGLNISKKLLFLPQILHQFQVGTNITESGIYSFYGLLVDSQTGDLASNLAQATVSVIVP